MPKHEVNVFIESCYPADRNIIRSAARKLIEESGVKTKTELSINIVGDRKMVRLNKKYRGKDETTPVLAFGMFGPSTKAAAELSRKSSGEDIEFPQAPDGILHLGDVVISYPQARELAKERDKLVDGVIGELVRHGVKNLLSI